MVMILNFYYPSFACVLFLCLQASVALSKGQPAYLRPHGGGGLLQKVTTFVYKMARFSSLFA